MQSSSQGARTEQSDLIELTGEGELWFWFGAEKYRRRRRDREPSGSNTSLGSLLRECTLLHPLPEARETRKAVLKSELLQRTFSKGLERGIVVVCWLLNVPATH